MWGEREGERDVDVLDKLSSVSEYEIKTRLHNERYAETRNRDLPVKSSMPDAIGI